MSNHKFKTHIDDVEVEISFDYQPSEVATRYYPGCDESVELCSVTTVLTRVELFGLNPECIAQIESECFEHLSDGPSD